MTNFTFTKLNTGGFTGWGVRAFPASGQPGDKVTVTKRDGGEREVTLGKIVDAPRGAIVFQIADEWIPATPRDDAPVPSTAPFSISDDELRTVLGSISVSIGETDGSPREWDLQARIREHLGMTPAERPDYTYA